MSMAESVATLTLPGGDSLACYSRVEPGTGHTRYKISGTRIRGVVTVIPAYEPDDVNPFTRRVRLQFGDCATGHAVMRDYQRDHLLTVNTVELVGAPVLDITHVPGIDPHDVAPYALGLHYLRRIDGREAPETTRRRVAALLAVIIDHWRSDPGNHTTRIMAARFAVRTGGYLNRKADAMRETSARITELRAELDRHTMQHKRMTLLRDTVDIDPPGPDTAA